MPLRLAVGIIALGTVLWLLAKQRDRDANNSELQADTHEAAPVDSESDIRRSKHVSLSSPTRTSVGDTAAARARVFARALGPTGEFSMEGVPIDMSFAAADGQLNDVQVANGDELPLELARTVRSATVTVSGMIDARQPTPISVPGAVQLVATTGSDSIPRLELAFSVFAVVSVQPNDRAEGTPAAPLCGFLGQFAPPADDIPRLGWVREQVPGGGVFVFPRRDHELESLPPIMTLLRGDGTAIGHGELVPAGRCMNVRWLPVGAIRVLRAIEQDDAVNAQVEISRTGQDHESTSMVTTMRDTADFRWVPQGVWEMSVRAPGSAPWTSRVDVQRGRLSHVDVTAPRLAESRDVSVVVRMQSGAPVDEDVELEIIDEDRLRAPIPVSEVNRDEAGTIRVQVVVRRSGRYRIRVVGGAGIAWIASPAELTGNVESIEVLGLDGLGLGTQIVELRLDAQAPDGIQWSYTVLALGTADTINGSTKQLRAHIPSVANSNGIRIVGYSKTREFDPFVIPGEQLPRDADGGIVAPHVVDVSLRPRRAWVRVIDAAGAGLSRARLRVGDRERLTDAFGLIELDESDLLQELRLARVGSLEFERESVEWELLTTVRAGGYYEFRPGN